MLNRISPIISTHYSYQKNSIGFGINKERLEELMMKRNFKISLGRTQNGEFTGKLNYGEKGSLVNEDGKKLDLEQKANSFDELLGKIAGEIPERTDIYHKQFTGNGIATSLLAKA